MSFSDKVALITGASSGIGAATAKLFSDEGAKVVLVGRNETKLAKVASECNDPLVINADITDNEEAKRVIEETINTFGKIDVLVNNAGMVRPENLLEENALDVFDEVMKINLRSVFNMTRLAAPYLIENKGNVVNISSTAGKKVLMPYLTYGVSKAAVENLTKALALDLAKHGVRVNTISPGPVKTDLLENAEIDVEWDTMSPHLPLGKVCEPEEVGHLVLFLASDKAGSITGVDYVIDNGLLLK